MHDAAEALNSLSAQIGLSALAFDDEGECGIVIDNETEIFFHGRPDGDNLRIWGVIGDLHPRGAPLALHLLALNFDEEQTGAAAFAVDALTDEILLTRRISIRPTSEEEFLAIVEEFVQRVEYWMDYLPRMALESDPMEEDAAADTGAILIRG